jgi:hypothetical protein
MKDFRASYVSKTGALQRVEQKGDISRKRLKDGPSENE